MFNAILITLFTFCIMEGITWLTHKFVMHGGLWILHEDHHQPVQGRTFEKNDLFFVIFAVPAMALFGCGTFLPGWAYCTWIGLGITLYGFAYFVVHDIVIHQRFRIFSRSSNFYIRAIRKAHKIHHKHLGREEGECFGMLWVPVRYFREAWNTPLK